ncbi:MAG TPA: hypothetical protein VJ792_02350 [Candidatus Nitrosotalea sp.]|nr:hypothetical protein [Candidatus Nitrosotalea sp.]
MTTISSRFGTGRWARFWAAIIPALLLATAGLAGTSLPAASASSDGDEHHHATHGLVAAHAWGGTCPSQEFLKGPGVAGQKQILNISWIGKNDEDSGLAGYWAMDYFKTDLKVWLLPNGTFYAEKTYHGVFVTPQGAVSPNSTSGPPTGHVQNFTSFGAITGGYVATFSGTFAPGTQHTSGPIGSFDYGGTMKDVLLQTYGNGQTGDAHAYDWTVTYFTGVTNFDQPHWGWSYKLDPIFESQNSVNEWCNYNPPDGGNSGDIYTP